MKKRRRNKKNYKYSYKGRIKWDFLILEQTEV